MNRRTAIALSTCLGLAMIGCSPFEFGKPAAPEPSAETGLWEVATLARDPKLLWTGDVVTDFPPEESYPGPNGVWGRPDLLVFQTATPQGTASAASKPGIAVFDASGAALWSAEFEAGDDDASATVQAMVIDDDVISVVGDAKSLTVNRHDGQSGNTKWKVSLPGATHFFLDNVYGDHLYLMGGSNPIGLAALDLTNGTRLVALDEGMGVITDVENELNLNGLVWAIRDGSTYGDFEIQLYGASLDERSTPVKLSSDTTDSIAIVNGLLTTSGFGGVTQYGWNGEVVHQIDPADDYRIRNMESSSSSSTFVEVEYIDGRESAIGLLDVESGEFTRIETDEPYETNFSVGPDVAHAPPIEDVTYVKREREDCCSTITRVDSGETVYTWPENATGDLFENGFTTQSPNGSDFSAFSLPEQDLLFDGTILPDTAPTPILWTVIDGGYVARSGTTVWVYGTTE